MKQITALTPRPASKPCKGIPTTTQAEIDAAAHGTPTPRETETPEEQATDAARKDAELKATQAAATEKLKQLIPQYKQAISQLERTAYQLLLAEQQVTDFRQQVTQNMYAAEQAHRYYGGQQTPTTLTQQVAQLSQQETQAEQPVSQLAGQILTLQQTVEGHPVSVTVSSTEYRTLTLHMADVKVERKVGVLLQVEHDTSNKACVTDTENGISVCTVYTVMPEQVLGADYRILTQKLNATSYEVSAN